MSHFYCFILSIITLVPQLLFTPVSAQRELIILELNLKKVFSNKNFGAKFAAYLYTLKTTTNQQKQIQNIYRFKISVNTGCIKKK